MRSSSLGLWFFACVIAGSLIGCAADSGSTGTVHVELVGQAPSGVSYRLRDAVITVSGADYTRAWRSEDDPAQTSLSDDVEPGTYTASLADGWRLERIDSTGGVAPVFAQLISDNPVAFTVAVQQRTSVPLRFRIDSDVVEMSEGYSVVLEIDEAPHTPTIVVVGTTVWDDPCIFVFAGGATGDVAPLRTIMGPSTRLWFPTSVVVDRGQIVVGSESAINVYPLGASGDVAPVQRIAGPATGLFGALDVRLVGDQIFVAQSGSVLVFPRWADGDVAPLRTLADYGGSGGGMLAIDGDEMFVAGLHFVGNEYVDRIEVYPTTAAGAPPPTRIVVPPQRRGGAPCYTGGIAVSGGRIYRSSYGCGGSVSAFPQDASGNIPSLTSIIGSNTGLSTPWAVARFRDSLYVVERDRPSIRVFPANASSDTPPVQVIAGDRTNVYDPRGIAVF